MWVLIWAMIRFFWPAVLLGFILALLFGINSSPMDYWDDRSLWEYENDTHNY